MSFTSAIKGVGSILSKPLNSLVDVGFRELNKLETLTYKFANKKIADTNLGKKITENKGLIATASYIGSGVVGFLSSPLVFTGAFCTALYYQENESPLGLTEEEGYTGEIAMGVGAALTAWTPVVGSAITGAAAGATAKQAGGEALKGIRKTTTNTVNYLSQKCEKAYENTLKSLDKTENAAPIPLDDDYVHVKVDVEGVS